MNYLKVYNELIQSRLKNPPKENFEKHHILPKSLYPKLTKDENNLVKLTYKEHYIAHHLLYRYYKSIGDKNAMYKMACAWRRMCHRKDGLKVSLNQFEKAKIAMANSQKGKIHPFYSKHHSEQTKSKISKTVRNFANKPEIKKKWRQNDQIKKVLCIETGEIFYSASEASRIKGINRGNLCTCCRCQKGSVGGYHWKYV